MGAKEGRSEHTTLVTTAGLLADAIDHYGLDHRLIAQAAGIDPDKVYDPTARLPVSQLQRVWTMAVDQTGDPCFGLTFAQYIQPAALYGLGLAWISSSSLRDGLERLVRYQRVISTILQFEIVPDELGCAVVLGDDLYQKSYGYFPHPAAVDAGMATFYRMSRITVGPELRAERVMLKRDKPHCANRFNDFFGVEVIFSAPQNRVVFDREVLDARLSTANPELARINDQVVIDYLRRFDKSGLALRVRSEIIDRLPSGLPQQAQVAVALAVSPRNLQRRLREEGTSYKQLLDEVRKALAVQYLEGSERSVIEIGYLLGFSEPSNFSRAFRRWTGSSPQSHRG
ncbi:MAG: AraC family transcriptional regulator [Gammaproteobacteria bacterium]|nr:AraC family transcriptional regulator [Gammaproteobacteria bacterium]